MTVVATWVSYPILIALYALLYVLGFVYFIDYMHELFTDFKLWMLPLALFAFPIIIMFMYLAAGAATGPSNWAKSEDASTGARIAGLLLTPVGLVIGFLFWQAQNWFFFGVLDVDPWIYNGIFRHVGLAV